MKKFSMEKSKQFFKNSKEKLVKTPKNREMPREEDYSKKSRKRNIVVFVVVVFLFFLEMFGLFYNSSIVDDINKKADRYEKMAIMQADAQIEAGDVYDRNNNIIAMNCNTDNSVELNESIFKDEEETKEETKSSEVHLYSHDYAYSQIVGFTGNGGLIYGLKEGEEDYIWRSQYRLLEYYEDYLYKTYDIDDTKGCSIYLNLDSKLQEYVYKLMKNEIGANNRGSAIVMNSKTGEILAMVSLPSFNVNDLDGEEGTAKLYGADEDLEMSFPITHKGYSIPGSIFKVVTATALIDSGFEDFTVKDEATVIGRTKVKNSYDYSEDNVGYHKAIIKSSNVFFASAANKVGGKKFQEIATEKFLIGKDVELDFGIISSNWNMNINSIEEVAATGYGQGKTLLSTIYEVMIANAIGNDGKMMEPRVMDKIVNSRGETVMVSEENILSEVTSKRTADLVADAMMDATIKHAYIYGNPELNEIYTKYKIATKTGTGQIDKKINDSAVISFAPADAQADYVVVVNQCETENYGRELLDTVGKIYEYLYEKYESK